jgi:drug/metabolite transporter (DMT)-like permease
VLTVVVGLLSALSYALSDMNAQHVSRRIGAVVPVLFWVLVTGVALIVPAMLVVDGVDWHGSEWTAVAWATFSGVVYLGAYGCLLAGLRRGDLSLVTALTASQGAFAVILAVVTGERFGGILLLGLLLAITGAVLAALQGRARTTAGAGWALASGFLFALVMLGYDQAGALPSLSTAAISRAVSLVVFTPIAAFVLLRARGPSLGIGAGDTGATPVPSLRLPRGVVRFAIAAGVLEVLGLALLTAAIRVGPLSIAAVAAAQFATFAAILGLVFLGERPRWWQLVGIGATITGVSLLSAFA